MGEEMVKYLVGPMPIQQFLDEFFPISELPKLDKVPLISSRCYDDTVSAKKGTGSYNNFVSLWYEFCYLSSHILFFQGQNDRHSPLTCELSIHHPVLIEIPIWTFHSKSNQMFGSIALTQIPA
jgi:hypothetical protein